MKVDAFLKMLQKHDVKRMGNMFVIKCLFCHHKHSSLRFDTDRQKYHCFICNKGGDISSLAGTDA